VRKPKIYVMRREGWNDCFLLHIFKDSKSMRKYIVDLAKKEGWTVPTDGWDETRGMVHPMITTDNVYAYMFLAEDSLGVGVVSHESLHVAMAHERYVLRFGMSYGPEVGSDEERLAYYLTSVTRGVYSILYENGHIKGKVKA
jgi:hypothetical protein